MPRVAWLYEDQSENNPEPSSIKRIWMNRHFPQVLLGFDQRDVKKKN